MKRKIVLSILGVVLSLILLVVSSYLVENEMIGPEFAIALTVVSSILVLAAIFYAAKIEYQTGIYECRKCGHTFKPTFKEYLMGSHTLTTRRLKCPKCKEKSWCRFKREI